ncbi:MAG: response regulator [Fibrobacterota bacterium]
MKGKILIVDDESEIREMVSDFFSVEDYYTETAESPDEALSKMSEKWFEVLISDIKMPGGSGIDLLRTVKEQYPMTHVIMITGHISLDNALACMRRGADTCIFKPIESFDELSEAVENAFSQLENWQNKLLQLKTMKDGND